MYRVLNPNMGNYELIHPHQMNSLTKRLKDLWGKMQQTDDVILSNTRLQVALTVSNFKK